jgi:hypothetical protein
MRDTIHLTSVEDAFWEEKFWAFRAFCKRKGIKDVSQLSLEHVKEHAQRKNTNPKTVSLIKQRLNKMLNSETEKMVIFEEIDKNQKIKHSITLENAIETIFADNFYRTFREFCKKNNIYTVHDITKKDFENYSNVNGVGEKKVEVVKEEVRRYLNNSQDQKLGNVIEGQNPVIENIGLENILPDKITEDPKPFNHKQDPVPPEIEQVYADNVFRTFRKYCTVNKITTVLDITDQHLNEYVNMRGVGVARLEAVKLRMNEYVNSYRKSLNAAKEEKPEPNSIIFSEGSNKIEEVFNDQKFIRFKVFCKRRGVTFLEEITNAHLEEFGNERQIGEKKVEDVRQILSAYAEFQISMSYFTSGDYYEYLKDDTVQQVLFFYGFQSNSKSMLKMKDIEGKSLNEIQEEFTPALLLALSNRLQKQKHPEKIIKHVLDKFTDRELQVLQHRYRNYETLEIVGSRLGVTRERIRQIQKAIIKRVSTYLNRAKFATIIKIMADSKSFVTKQDLLNLVGKEYETIINLLAYEKIIFSYYKKMDIYFFDDGKNIHFSALEELIMELPDVFYFKDYEQHLKEGLYSIGIENPPLKLIHSFLETEKFTRYGEVYSKNRLSVNEVLLYLFKHYITKPLRLDEEGVCYLKALASNHLDFEMDSGVHSIANRLRDSADILLVDSSTFAYFDKDSFDTKVIIEIESYLLQEFGHRDVLNADELFTTFQNQLLDARISNKIHLYSLVKHFLQDKFIIGRGNTLNIYKTEESKISVKEQLINLMKQHGGQCTKKQLLEVIQPLYRIESAISTSDKIIPWGSDYILLEKLEFTTVEKNLLKSFVNIYFDKGYSTASFIYFEMMANKRLFSLLTKKKIDDYYKLASILKVLLPQIKGSANFLYVEGHELDSFEKVICADFTFKTSRKELKEFAFKYGYNNRNAAEINKRLLDKGIFIEIGLDEIYPANLFKISQSDLEEICVFAELVMGRNEYLSISNLHGYEEELPELDFPWNAFLLKSVLEMSGYRRVKKIISDYRYDKIITVRESSEIQSFEDLVLHIIKTEYNGDPNEEELYDYLADKGILNNQEYTFQKVLPNEIKTSKRFIEAVQLRSEQAK